MVLANADATSIDTPAMPKQGHISLTENDDEMVVSYVSGSTNIPTVRYPSECGPLMYSML